MFSPPKGEKTQQKSIFLVFPSPFGGGKYQQLNSYLYSFNVIRAADILQLFAEVADVLFQGTLRTVRRVQADTVKQDAFESTWFG